MYLGFLRIFSLLLLGFAELCRAIWLSFSITCGRNLVSKLMKSVVDVMLDLWMPIAENWISSNVKFVLQVVPNTLYFCWKSTLVDFSRWSICAFKTNYRSPLTTKARVCSPWVWCDSKLFHHIEHIFMPIKFLCFCYRTNHSLSIGHDLGDVFVIDLKSAEAHVDLSLWNISWCKVDFGV